MSTKKLHPMLVAAMLGAAPVAFGQNQNSNRNQNSSDQNTAETRQSQQRDMQNNKQYDDKRMSDRKQNMSNMHVKPADQIVGVNLLNNNNETIGEINQLLLNPETGKVERVVLNDNGAIGLGAITDKYVVDHNQLRMVERDGDWYAVLSGANGLEQLPRYNDEAKFNQRFEVQKQSKKDGDWSNKSKSDSNRNSDTNRSNSTNRDGDQTNTQLDRTTQEINRDMNQTDVTDDANRDDMNRQNRDGMDRNNADRNNKSMQRNTTALNRLVPVSELAGIAAYAGDTEVGTLRTLLIDCNSGKVVAASIDVEHDDLADVNRLIPFDQIARVGPERIDLRASTAQLERSVAEPDDLDARLEQTTFLMSIGSTYDSNQ